MMVAPTDDEKMAVVRREDIKVSMHENPTEMTEDAVSAEKKLLRKIDLHVVPILWYLNMPAFLDRTKS